METDEMELEQVKVDVYETWAVINRAFEQIITALGKLEKRGVLKWDYAHNHKRPVGQDQFAHHDGSRQERGGRPQPLRQDESRD